MSNDTKTYTICFVSEPGELEIDPSMFVQFVPTEAGDGWYAHISSVELSDAQLDVLESTFWDLSVDSNVSELTFRVTDSGLVEPV